MNRASAGRVVAVAVLAAAVAAVPAWAGQDPAPAAEEQGAPWLLAAEEGEMGEMEGEAAQDRDRDRDRMATRLADEVQGEGGLTARDRVQLQNRIYQHLSQGGDEQNVRQMTRAAVGEGCKGECLTESVRAMNRVMAFGDKSPGEARSMVTEELRQAARAGDAAGLTQRFEMRMEKRLQEMPAYRERGPRMGHEGMMGPEGGMGGMGGGGMGGGRR